MSRLSLIGGALLLGALALGAAWYLGGEARENELKIDGLEGRIEDKEESDADFRDVQGRDDLDDDVDRVLGGNRP